MPKNFGPQRLGRPSNYYFYKELDQLAEKIHANNVDKGFAESMNDINGQLLLMVSELTEAQDEIRSGREIGETYFSNAVKPEGFGVELADALIRLLGFMRHHNLPIAQLVKLKMNYNATRPHKHGKQF